MTAPVMVAGQIDQAVGHGSDDRRDEHSPGTRAVS
jgi:hypothetical protein